MIDRISVELTNRCGKACWFCYNASVPAGETAWTEGDVIAFARDCAAHGVRAISFGGGEPLESPLLYPALAALRGAMFRSLTTNGLHLDDELESVVEVAPEKVHVSIHFPSNAVEVSRVIRQVQALAAARIDSGVNLLVRKSELAAAKQAARALHAAGIANDRIVFLPMRSHDTPTPAELADVAGGTFQSMTCLARCGRSPRFAAIGWDRHVAWCSYTKSRMPLATPSHAAMIAALRDLGLESCESPRVSRLRAHRASP